MTDTGQAFLASIEKTCRKYTAQVRRYQDAGEAAVESGKRELPADAVTHMTGVVESLAELSRYVCHEPDLLAHDYYEYRLVSQLLVLAWKATVLVADIVAHLQHQILCTGSWLARRPSSPLVTPACLQGYRLCCRIAEDCVGHLKGGLRIQLTRRHDNESMLLLMSTGVDGQREKLENWLKTLHNDMSSVVTTVDPGLSLLSFPAKWE